MFSFVSSVFLLMSSSSFVVAFAFYAFVAFVVVAFIFIVCDFSVNVVFCV